MAFDDAGFFAIVGKYVKAIDIYDGYIDAIETHKGAIQDILETENVPDLYTTLPGLFAGMQGNASGWITALITDLQRLFRDRTYVVEELPAVDRTTFGILSAIRDYMITGSKTILKSTVTLGGADVDLNATAITSSNAQPRLFASRLLDGTQSPGNGAPALKSYANVVSQLARSTTVFAEVVGNVLKQEQAKLFSTADATGPYVLEDEEPGAGPTLNSVEVGNLVGTNYDFSSWAGNEPNLWVMSGGVSPTNYVDASGTGAGPLEIKTVNVLAYRQLTGLVTNKLYFFGVLFNITSTDAITGTVGMRIRNLAGTDVVAMQTATADPGDDGDGYSHAYGFFVLPDGTDLTNLYAEVKYTAATGANVARIRRVVVTPATYYNGLGWAWWGTTKVTNTQLPLKTRNSLAVVNNDAGVFQRFFRKAFNIQLPTATAAPTYADSLAT